MAPYDVAGVHLQSATDTVVTTSTETIPVTPVTSVTPEPSGISKNDQIAAFTPKPKKVSFFKQTPLSSQNNQRNRTQSGDHFDDDNRKRRSCTLCDGPHTNLV